MSTEYNLQNENIGYAGNNTNYNPISVKRSRCPLGAPLGAIGTCCGLNCTRKCAEEA